MKATRALLLSIAVLVSTCATTSPVVPIGSGRYEVIGHSATVFGTACEQKIKLTGIASDYCAKQGSQTNVEGEQGEDGTWVRSQRSTAAALADQPPRRVNSPRAT